MRAVQPGAGRADDRAVGTVTTLEGTLEEFPLDAVVSLLARSGQAGALEVRAPGLGDAPVAVWFDGGAVLVTSRSNAVDVLFHVLLTGGEFTFVPRDDRPAGHDVAVPAMELLAEVEARLAEWREIATTVPSTAAVFRLTGALPEGVDSFVVERCEWEVLAQLDGVRSVAEVARTASVSASASAFDVCRMLHRLAGVGAVERVVDDG